MVSKEGCVLGAARAVGRLSGAALVPVSSFLLFVMFWFLVGPALWWWLYARTEWSVLPDRWAILFWFVMFLVWCAVCLFAVLLLERCRSTFVGHGDNPPILARPLSKPPLHETPAPKLEATGRAAHPKALSPSETVSDWNLLLATGWFLENERELYTAPQPRPVWDLLPLPDESVCLEMDDTGLSPRELFFRDLTHPGNRLSLSPNESADLGADKVVGRCLQKIDSLYIDNQWQSRRSSDL